MKGLEKMLIYAPRYCELFSPAFGTVIYVDVVSDADDDFSIKTRADKTSEPRNFYYDGTLGPIMGGKDLMLFPSADCRNWFGKFELTSSHYVKVGNQHYFSYKENGVRVVKHVLFDGGKMVKTWYTDYEEETNIH